MFTGKQIDYSAQTIRNDGWWPDVAVAEFERRTAQPADLDHQTIASALLSAIGQINLQLQVYQDSKREQGYLDAAAVPGVGLEGGNNALTEQYLAALFTRAQAELLPAAASVTERTVANKTSEREPQTRDQLLAISQQLIRVIKGKRRCGVALI